MVSCKRKSHHLTVVRRKHHRFVRNLDATNKENEMKRSHDTQQEMLLMDPLEFPLNISHNSNTSSTGSEQTDYYTLTEVTSTDYVSLVWFYEKKKAL